MIVGSVHFVEFVELLFWLREIGYEGWYSMDQYPYREDGQGALRSSVEFLQGVEAMLDAGAMADLRALIAEGDAVKSTSWLGRTLLGKR
jgi:xylose isomerase